MKSAFAIALAVGTTNAASLRERQTKAPAKAVSVHDSSFVEALASRYDCRVAGATLEETIKKVKQANAVERTALATDCVKRVTAYNTPWDTAQSDYTRLFPLVESEEKARQDEKDAAARTLFQTTKDTHDTAVRTTSDTRDTAQSTLAEDTQVFDEAKAAWKSAKTSKTDQVANFNDHIKPTGLARNQKTYDDAKALVDADLAEKLKAATAARDTVSETCKSVTAVRSKHIESDNLLLTHQIQPLIKELSEAKCVDKLTDNNYNEKKKAYETKGSSAAAASLIQVFEMSKAQCAMQKIKASSFLQTTHYLGSISLDAQYKVFTDRVEEERTHMNELNERCEQSAVDNFNSEKSSAETKHEEEVTARQKAHTEADAADDKILADLIVANDAIIANKAEVMVEPKRAMDASQVAFNNADVAFESAKDVRKSTMILATKQRDDSITNAATYYRDTKKEREDFLDAIKATAQKKFTEDKQFVDTYCSESKKDLENEHRILAAIDNKLTGLFITDDEHVGKAAEDARDAAKAAAGN